MYLFLAKVFSESRASLTQNIAGKKINYRPFFFCMTVLVVYLGHMEVFIRYDSSVDFSPSQIFGRDQIFRLLVQYFCE